MVDVVSPLTRVPPLQRAADRAVEADPELAGLDERELVARINALRAERDAVILAHSYQIPAIQDMHLAMKPGYLQVVPPDVVPCADVVESACVEHAGRPPRG